MPPANTTPPQDAIDPAGVIETVAHAFVAHDADFRIIACNTAGASFCGQPREEILGKTPWDLCPARAGTEFERQLRKVMQDRVAAIFEYYDPILEKWLEIQVSPGSWGGVFVWITDITATKLAEIYRERVIRQTETERQLLREIVEKAPMAIATITCPGFVYELVNPAFQALVPGRSMTGLRVAEVWPEAAESLVPLLEHVARSGETRSETDGAYRIRRCPNGPPEQIFVSSTWIPLLGADGKPERILVLARETTSEVLQRQEQQRMKEALRQSEERLRLAMDAARIGTWSRELATGEIIWSDRCRAIYGLTATEPITFDRFRGLLHPEDRERVTDLVATAIRDRSSFEIAFRVIWPDGSEHWISARGQASADASGRAARLYGIVMDIDAQKRAELALRRSEERLRAFVDSSLIGIGYGDVSGRILDCNDKLLEMLGRTRAEVLAGKVCWDAITPPEYLATVTDAIAEARTKGTCAPFESVYLKPDGTRVPMLLGFSLMGEKREEGVCFVLDISAWKEAQTSLSEKETLLKEIHHRVKNNLQIVSSLLHMQAASLENGPARDALRESENRILSMAMIHEFLYQGRDFARIDLISYLQRVVDYLTSSYGSSRVRCHVEGEGPILVEMDRAIPCGLIVNELIANGFKHAFPERGGTIVVNVSVQDGRIRIAVQDDGVGLPGDFEVGASRGLGLQLVHTLATRQLHGAVRASNGAGARFEIEFHLR